MQPYKTMPFKECGNCPPKNQEKQVLIMGIEWV
jgi:hypothetical protein